MLLLSCAGWHASAIAQAPSADVVWTGDRPWERLPDGRVVIEIKGVKLAFDPDIDRGAPHASVLFTPVRSADQQSLTFRQVVDDPALARGRFAAWRAARIRTSNNRTMRGRYLDRYDRQFVPSTMRIELTVWNDARDALCAVFLATIKDECKAIDDVAHTSTVPDEDGFIIGPSRTRSPPYVTYVIPAQERVAANGEAVYFRCYTISMDCRNHVIHFFGQAIRKTVSLYYEFQLSQYSKSSFRRLDSQLRVIFDDIIISAS